ncbi:MAG: Dam family site-specific DNA-(adenine-N6)-methyltransferase [Clostridia bacterium]|nr:Dam family site-specific DNA-(adenine-N6)-methyltransferase [Clostridia bacterium]
MKYMSASEAAEKWNISHRRVITLCRENRIENAAMLGNMWIIPKDAKKPSDRRSVRYDNNENARPFLKWAGGKSQLLPQIRQFYPKELGVTIKKYCEPMVGAGAVLFDVLNSYCLDQILINDANYELINAFESIKYNADILIAGLEMIEDEYLKLNDYHRKQYYYDKRFEFNEFIKNPSAANALTRATLFIFLNKTCFNGLYRVNKKGEFNVPIGSYKNPTICDKENILLVCEKLQNVKMTVAHYKTISSFVDENTFVYFDPPYRPITKTSRFTSYNLENFSDKHQIELAEYIKELTKQNVKIMANNSDPKNIDPNDNFFDDLYAPLNIYRVDAKRYINSKGSNRGLIKELLITNY